MTFTHGGMFEGMGATTMAASAALGVELESLWFSDIKPASIAFLEERFPQVPNIGDMKAVDFHQVPKVDVITASWPCQPHSAAGKRLGEADPRALWPDVIRAVKDVRPFLFFGENVARICTNGELRRVVRSFGEAGYVGAWRCITAASVGAPHRRDRCFVVAIDADALSDPTRKRWAERLARSAGVQWGSDAPVCGDGVASDPDGAGVRLESGRDDRGREGAPDVPEVAGSDGPGGQLLPTPGAYGRRARVPSPATGRARLESGRRNLEDAVAAHLIDDPDTRLDYVPSRADRGLEPHSAGIARRIVASNAAADEGPLLPTPIARDSKGSDANRVNESGRPLSETVMRLLKTPTANLATNGCARPPETRRAGGHGPTLDDEAVYAIPSGLAELPPKPGDLLLPTPIAGDAKSARNNTQNDGAGSKRGNPGWTLSDVVYAERWGPYAGAIAKWESVLGRTAPLPTQRSSRKPYGPQLSPAFVEWMMGLPEGWVTDAGQLSARGLAPAERNARLSLLGDGVCPQQAEAAFNDLLGHVFAEVLS